MLLYAITNRRLLGRRRDREARSPGFARRGMGSRRRRHHSGPRKGSCLSPSCSRLPRASLKPCAAPKSQTRVLVNGPAQVALDAGADGVHLHANAGSRRRARRAASLRPRRPRAGDQRRLPFPRRDSPGRRRFAAAVFSCLREGHGAGKHARSGTGSSARGG